MITLLKYLVVWLVCAIATFSAMFVIGSFCSMSLDINEWTNGGGRFGLAVVAIIGGFMGVCGVSDMERLESMTKDEREKELARRAAAERDHSHADY